MATYPWKVLSSTLGLAMPFLSPLAITAVGLMGKLDSFRCSVLEAKENQQVVLQLYARAGRVSAMIEHSLAERCRRQDEAFNELVSSLQTTLEDVERFYEKFWRQLGWFQRLLHGDEVKSEFEGLWRRLDAHTADYRTLLLERIVFRGPSERILHPQMREFWRLSMNNALEAKWFHFWDQLGQDLPQIKQLLSNYNVKLLEAKADPRDRQFVGPREINNLFRPPRSSVEQIVRTALAGCKRPLDFAKSTRTNKRVRLDNSTTVQFWTGYWERDCYVATQTVELLVARSNHKIYGGGSDEIGEFTCSGQCTGTRIRFVKHYLGRHKVEYKGAFKNATIDGFWTKDSGDARKGEFKLKERMQIAQSIATGRETGIVQVGVIQHWKGHSYNRVGESPGSNMSAEIVFTHTHKIYGSGKDSVGCFTWLGHYHNRGDSETIVHISQQYEGKHVVHFVGAVGQSGHSFCVGQEDLRVVMEGSWMHSNDLETGTFCLQPQLNNFPGARVEA